MKTILSLCLVALLTACGGGGDEPESPNERVMALMTRQSFIAAGGHQPQYKDEWNRNWPEILRLNASPETVWCAKFPRPSDAWNACFLESQELTHPWIWS